LFSCPNSRATGINSAGHVVGYGYINTTPSPPSHAFLYNETGMHDLGDGGLGGTSARAIGEDDTIVGKVGNFAGIYRNGTWTKLNDLIGDPQVNLFEATDINASGQILAYGLDSFPGNDTQYYSFILTPVPEPATLGILTAGGGGGAIVLRRRRR